jgi:NADH:ubiquinone oxidoreductase subunit 5 (subunit L)/multisubunit Na+/H+ antiporter MnhA subunit
MLNLCVLPANWDQKLHVSLNGRMATSGGELSPQAIRVLEIFVGFFCSFSRFFGKFFIRCRQGRAQKETYRLIPCVFCLHLSCLVSFSQLLGVLASLEVKNISIARGFDRGVSTQGSMGVAPSPTILKFIIELLLVSVLRFLRVAFVWGGKFRRNFCVNGDSS